MSFSNLESEKAVSELNSAINECVRESGGILSRFRGFVPLSARIFEFREIDR